MLVSPLRIRKQEFKNSSRKQWSVSGDFTSRGCKSEVEKVIEMKYFYEEIIQSEKDTKLKLQTRQI